jgi:Fe-S-cluster containining protein
MNPPVELCPPGPARGRTCGPCAACCTATPVADLGKPAGTRCRHQAGGDSPACGSCAIYADRPNACQVYRCAWLDGYGPDEHRPDLTGVVSELMFQHGRPFLAALTLVPGRARHNRVTRDLVAWWRGQGVAVTIGRDVFATAAQRADLSNCMIRFADGKTVRVGGL